MVYHYYIKSQCSGMTKKPGKEIKKNNMSSTNAIYKITIKKKQNFVRQIKCIYTKYISPRL